MGITASPFADFRQSGVPVTLSSDTPDIKLIPYFLDIEESIPDVPLFQKMWRRIPDEVTQEKHLFNIIEGTAYFAKKHYNSNSPHRTNAFYCLDYARANLSCWEKPAMCQMENFGPGSLAMIIWSLATLAAKPSDEFLSAWEKQAIQQMDSFKPRNLSNTIWGLGKLAVQPSYDFLTRWQAQAESNISEFHEQNLSNSLWGLAIFNILEKSPAARSAAEFIHKEMQMRGLMDKDSLLTIAGRRQTTNACAVFDLPCALPQPAETNTIGTDEQRFSEIFREAGFGVCKKNGFVHRLNHRPDIVLNTQHMMIELDGRPHFNFSAEGETYNGDTDMQSYLIRKFTRSHLLRIPFTVANKILASPQVQQLTRIFTTETLNKPVDAYVLHDAGDRNVDLHVDPFFSPVAV